MGETYVDRGPKVKRIPEVYQVEICSACNLECPMCLRTTHMGRKPGLVDMKLLRLMHERGDFKGSMFTELQMAGEPTLHPQLMDIISYLKHEVGILVGLSTHGLQIKKHPYVKAALGHLDTLTISVDSLDPETYHKMRYPATVDQLLENLESWFAYAAAKVHNGQKIPFTELQLVVTPMAEKSGDVASLEKLMKEKGWDQYALVRTVHDCFGEMQERFQLGSSPRNTELCLDPFTSVSVAHNGDVISCCFIFDPKKDEINYYGNLFEQSLEDIWNGERANKMRESHIREANGMLTDIGGSFLSGQCKKCYAKSPNVTIHHNIVSRLIRLRGI